MMPHYEPVKSAVDRASYPLLMVPYGIINLSSGWLPNPPFLYKTLFPHQLSKNDAFVRMNPKTADEYHLEEGDLVTVESPLGGIQVRVNRFEGAMPGILYLLLGFGHTAYDEFSRGKGGREQIPMTSFWQRKPP